MSSDIQQSNWAADLHPPRWSWFLPLTLPLLVIAFIVYQSTQVLPRIMVAPGFSLVDQEGKRLSNEDLRGNLVLYAFSQPDCQAPCLETSRTLEQVQKAAGALEVEGVPLHFVTVANGQSLARGDYPSAGEQTTGADSAHWHFVSDASEQFSTMTQANGTDSMSTPRFALVDGWGIVRAFYAGATPDIDQIRGDLHLVAREARNSSGVNRYAYEAVHLFMCHNNIVAIQ